MVRKLKLSTVDYDSFPTTIIRAQTDDINSRSLVVEVTDDRGAIDLSAYTEVTLNVILPSGDIKYIPAEINEDDNTITVGLGSLPAQAGKFVCDITLVGDTDDGILRLTSRTFFIFVAEPRN